MKIKKLILNNFRGIEKSEFDLSDKFNVFVGVNGTGKTTILDSISIALSWLVNRIQREGSSGKPITESSIKNETSFSSIEIQVQEKEIDFVWKISKTARGNENIEKSDLIGVSELAAYFQRDYRELDQLPIIAYYPINRLVNNSTTDFSGKETLNILDVYDNALGGKTNYQSFFEWFRLQDDILNEKSSSPSKWMYANRLWVKGQIKKLLEKFDYLISDDKNLSSFKERIKSRLLKDELIYENPRYLFRELIEVIDFAHMANRKKQEFETIFFELESILYKMSSLSDTRKDDILEFSDYPYRNIIRLIGKIGNLDYHKSEKDSYLAIINFIWNVLLFAVSLSLWWLNDKSRKELELLFSGVSPINPLKYSANPKGDNEEFVRNFENFINRNIKKYTKASKNQGRELNYVTKAIESFIHGYSNLRVSRIPRPHMLVDKFGVAMSLDQLSDGEKNLIALVGDIARRLSIANANSRNPLEGEGIILIDEIDLHLHPAWQRLMVPKLGSIFPNCQFIFTTHSPQVLSHTKPDSIFLLKQEHGIVTYSKALAAYGKDSNSILYDLMDTDTGVDDINKDLEELFKFIALSDLEKSEAIYNKLVKILLIDDPKMLAARTELEYLKENENEVHTEN